MSDQREAESRRSMRFLVCLLAAAIATFSRGGGVAAAGGGGCVSSLSPSFVVPPPLGSPPAAAAFEVPLRSHRRSTFGTTAGQRAVASVFIPPISGAGESLTQLASSFYDDFEDFGEIGPGGSDKKSDGNSDDGLPLNSESNDGESGPMDDDDAVMRSLRERMNRLSKMEDEDDEEMDNDEDEDADSGSAIPDLEGRSISSVDDLIGFAQSKARLEGSGKKDDEDWAIPVPLVDEETGEKIDFGSILEQGVLLMANPAKFCDDLNANSGSEKEKKLGLGALFDPFPSQPPSNDISSALLAKFGLNEPPQRGQGPDRRADLMPVLLLVDRDPLRGCQAVLINRRTGLLLGDLERQLGFGGENDDEDKVPPPKLGAFTIQPLMWGGASPNGSIGENEEESNASGGGGNGLDMLHTCSLVEGSTRLSASDGLYWGGDPVQAQDAMKDPRLEKPLSGFDFKFFIQSTKWGPNELEKEISDGTWYIAKVSKKILYKSRDGVGSRRSKPLWTEVMDLLGGKFGEVRDMLYKEDDDV